jgi:hypothetical protein
MLCTDQEGMDDTVRRWKCASYLWWSTVFGVSAALLACSYIPPSSTQANHLDERSLSTLAIILQLLSFFLLLIGCCLISKEHPEIDKQRFRFVRINLVGLFIFALATIVNSVLQLMSDSQLLRLSLDNITIQNYCLKHTDNFHECNCVSYTAIFEHVGKIFLTVMQTIFLLLFAGKRLKQRWWLQPMIATILAVDLYLAIWSAVHKFGLEQSDNESSSPRNESPLYRDFPSVPQPLRNVCLELAGNSFFYKLNVSAVKWLYPAQTEFYLCASGMFLSMWLNLGKVEDSTGKQTTRRRPPSLQGINGIQIRTMCSTITVVTAVIGSVLAFTLTVSNVVRGYVPCSTAHCPGNSTAGNTILSLNDAMLWDGSQWISHHSLALVVTILIFLDLICFHEKKHAHFGLDMTVLGILLPIVVVVKVMVIIAAGYFKPTECVQWIPSQLTIIFGVLALADGFLQTTLVFYCCEFSHRHISARSQHTRPTETTPLNGGSHICISRCLLLFLAIIDLPIWVDRSLENTNKQIQMNSAPAHFFGADTWFNVCGFFNPILALFYFHLSACLCELFLALTPDHEENNTDS